MEFNIGENVVFSGMGIGKIIGIEKKQFAGTTQDVYIIEENRSTTKVMIPISRTAKLRKILDITESNEILKIIQKPADASDEEITWNAKSSGIDKKKYLNFL